jgi:chromatin structure-remodeling complex protein RSC7
MQYPATMQSTRVRIEQVAPQDETAGDGSAMFPPVPLKLARNFSVIGTLLENPSAGVASVTYDKSAQADFLASFSGLGAVSQEIRDLLPADCRKAFQDALKTEVQWKSRWGTESDNMSRRQPVIDKAIVPYSMS